MTKRISDAVRVFENYLSHKGQHSVVRNLGAGRKATLEGTDLCVRDSHNAAIGRAYDLRPGQVREELGRILARPASGEANSQFSFFFNHSSLLDSPSVEDKLSSGPARSLRPGSPEVRLNFDLAELSEHLRSQSPSFDELVQNSIGIKGVSGSSSVFGGLLDPGSLFKYTLETEAADTDRVNLIDSASKNQAQRLEAFMELMHDNLDKFALVNDPSFYTLVTNDGYKISRIQQSNFTSYVIENRIGDMVTVIAKGNEDRTIKLRTDTELEVLSTAEKIKASLQGQPVKELPLKS